MSSLDGWENGNIDAMNKRELLNNYKENQEMQTLYELANLCRRNKEYGESYAYAKKAIENGATEDTLNLIKFELSISSYYLGFYDESLKHCDELLFDTKFSNFFKEQLIFNRRFTEEKIDIKTFFEVSRLPKLFPDSPEIFIGDWWPDHTKLWLSNLIVYLRKKGYRVIYNRDFCSAIDLRDKAKNSDCVIIWNAVDDYYTPIKEMCENNGIPYYITEVGYFPQKNYFTIDSNGINAGSELINDDLSWITDDHIQKLEERRKIFLKDRKREEKDYIFIPLQLPRDTNIRHHSPYKDMQLFIEHVEEKFKGEKVIIKRHPYDDKEYTSRFDIVTEGSSIEHILGAKLVYGINSTVLLEAALCKVPVEAIGDGFLKAHKGNHEKLLAALVNREIPVNSLDLDYWFDPILENIKKRTI